METLENIKSLIETAVPGAMLTVIPNDTPAAQRSLLVDAAHGTDVFRFLRDDPRLRFDYLSNVTGVDWLDTVIKEKVTSTRIVEGVEKAVEETVEKTRAGYLEAVYHLYSMSLKHGPLVLRMRTGNRTDQTRLPSVTPLFRSAEFQEREIYDLYGIVFEGHPDLRRLLMWERFEGHPMRKDYVPPDDFEYEPTPHDKVFERAQAHYPAEPPK